MVPRARATTRRHRLRLRRRPLERQLHLWRAADAQPAARTSPASWPGSLNCWPGFRRLLNTQLLTFPKTAGATGSLLRARFPLLTRTGVDLLAQLLRLNRPPASPPTPPSPTRFSARSRAPSARYCPPSPAKPARRSGATPSAPAPPCAATLPVSRASSRAAVMAPFPPTTSSPEPALPCAWAGSFVSACACVVFILLSSYMRPEIDHGRDPTEPSGVPPSSRGPFACPYLSPTVLALPLAFPFPHISI